MRTTISLDDQLAKKVNRAAAEKCLSVSALIVRTLDDALKQGEPPLRLVPIRGVDLGGPRSVDVTDNLLPFSSRYP